MALPGNVGFLSQSGALCTAILDWSLREHVGFSAFVSIGSMLDVGWGDLIDYLGDDPHTSSIVIYMESIGDARAFLSAAREVALTQADHRDQGGADRGGGQGGGVAHRRADRQRRGPRRRFPPLRRAPRRHDLRRLLPWPKCSPSSPARTAPADHRHQCGRPRRARHRRLDRRRRRTRRVVAARPSRLSTRCCRPPGAMATRSTSWATPTPSAMPRR